MSKTRSKNLSMPVFGKAAEPPSLQFVTVLPDGTEFSFSSGLEHGAVSGGDLSDRAACRQIALRVERLSRGLMDRAGGEASYG